MIFCVKKTRSNAKSTSTFLVFYPCTSLGLRKDMLRRLYTRFQLRVNRGQRMVMYRRRNARKMPIRMGAYLTRMAPEKAGRQQMGAFGCQLEKVRMEGRIGMY